MAEVKILIEGHHKDVEDGLIAGSSVTLVKSEGKNIIVDTGAFADEDNKIISALEKEGLKPAQINLVITTHDHWDHIANINLFKKAKLYKPFSSIDLSTNFRKREKIENEFEITKDVKIIPTPGHLEYHMSVIVNTSKGIVVISGDAISKEEFANMSKYPELGFVWNKDEYDKSRKKILAIADYIIPGHGKMFKVKK